MKDKIIGGVVAVVLGGTTFAVSQSDIVSNFSEETGMTQQESKEYIEEIQDDLTSFDEIGKTTASDGKDLIANAATIDCVNYEYEWESTSLDCETGKTQLGKIGKSELRLGNCYKALDKDLGAAAIPKINECIDDIDSFNQKLSLPAANKVLGGELVADVKKTNAYNKSVLKAAVESE